MTTHLERLADVFELPTIEGDARPFVDESLVLPSVEFIWKSNFSTDSSFTLPLSPTLHDFSSCIPASKNNRPGQGFRKCPNGHFYIRKKCPKRPNLSV